MPVEPSVNTYNALLHGYAMLWTSRMSEDERIVAAEELLQRMHARGLAPSRATFNCLLALHRYNMPRVRELLEQVRSLHHFRCSLLVILTPSIAVIDASEWD